MQITLSIYCFYALQCLVISGQFYHVLTKKGHTFGQQLLILSCLHVTTSTLWIAAISGMFHGLILEVLMVVSSLATLAYSFQLWNKQFHIPLQRNGIHWIVIHALAAIFLFSRIDLTSSLLWKEWTFLLVLTYAQGVSLFYGGKIFLHVIRRNDLNSIRRSALASSAVMVVFLPLILFFLQHFATQYILINVGFFLLVVTYFKESHHAMTPALNKEEQLERNQRRILSKGTPIFAQTKSEELEICEEQLEQCLLKTTRLEKESAQKSDLIEQYKIRLESSLIQNKKTVESVLQEYELTSRQFEVVELMVSGKSNAEIAAKLFITEGAVRTHLTAAYSKTGVRGAKKLRKFILNLISSN